MNGSTCFLGAHSISDWKASIGKGHISRSAPKIRKGDVLFLENDAFNYHRTIDIHMSWECSLDGLPPSMTLFLVELSASVSHKRDDSNCSANDKVYLLNCIRHVSTFY